MATKHDKEQLALGVNERVSVNQVLYAISELIGPCVGWPNWVTKIFWMQKLNTRNGLRLCTFVLGNGMPPHLLTVPMVACERGGVQPLENEK